MFEAHSFKTHTLPSISTSEDEWDMWPNIDEFFNTATRSSNDPESLISMVNYIRDESTTTSMTSSVDFERKSRKHSTNSTSQSTNCNTLNSITALECQQVKEETVESLFNSPVTFDHCEDTNVKTDHTTMSSTREAVVPPTNCVICNYPTTCFHYEVASCLGCKAFYRRTVIAQRHYVCRFNGSCAIKSGVRCRSCRYDACIRAGMDARSIKVSADQASKFDAMISEVDRRKRALDLDSSNSTEVAVATKIVPQFDQTADARVVDFVSYLELKFRQLRESTYNGKEMYNVNIRDLLSSSHHSQLGNAEKYQKITDIFEERKLYTQLPLEQLAYLQDVSKFVCLGKSRFKIKHWITSDLILSVEYLKAMPFYNDLDLNDREALVAHTTLVTTLLVESWYSYTNNSETIVMPDGTKPIMMRRQKFSQWNNIYEKYPNLKTMEIESFVRIIEPLARVQPDAEDYLVQGCQSMPRSSLKHIATFTPVVSCIDFKQSWEPSMERESTPNC
ncbi:Transcription factor HNF-4-like protein [Aphelenchoides besseyi]|nr:Transcription factor HNF-4-like protein [Aphelenchoides besseyi]KAI6208825.1 Transcription factor HNF-4-like protein [Aphelenchoides besseyi]